MENHENGEADNRGISPLSVCQRCLFTSIWITFNVSEAHGELLEQRSGEQRDF
jgi:hypothetical protein